MNYILKNRVNKGSTLMNKNGDLPYFMVHKDPPVKFFSRPVNMKELSLLFPTILRIFKSNISTFLKDQKWKFWYRLKEETQFFHLHRKKNHAKNHWSSCANGNFNVCPPISLTLWIIERGCWSSLVFAFLNSATWRQPLLIMPF